VIEETSFGAEEDARKLHLAEIEAEETGEEVGRLRAALAERTREAQQAQAEVVLLRAQLYEHHLSVIANLKAENEALRRALSRKTAEEGEPEAVG
jgi:cell shape-determining protein MreC